MEGILDPNCESLYEKLKHEQKKLQLKRRLLIGLHVSGPEQEQLNKLEFQEDKTLPESFLREDDVFYETVKAFIQKGFGSGNLEYHMDQDNRHVVNICNDLRILFSMLDDMTNNGLQLLAEMLTDGSIEFEKTRYKMKKIIREYAKKVIGNSKDSNKTNITEKLSQLIRDSTNFRRNHPSPLIPASRSYHTAVTKVLDGLEDMPFQTLSAMHRKLRGNHDYIPQLRPKKSGWGRSILIDQVRKSCMVLLSELGDEGELPEPLAKAMAVGGLWSKLIQGCPYGTEFWKFSPKIEALQNEIANAICVLNERVTFAELKNLQLLLDPNAELSNRSLRTAIRNLLTDYLFECSDMNALPDSLLKMLSLINGSARSTPCQFTSEQMEEDVECLLSVSAQMKQVIWDLIPEYDLDQDFADAYVEDLEDSDGSNDPSDSDGDSEQEMGFPENNLFHCGTTYNREEATGETNPSNIEMPAFRFEGNSSSPVFIPNTRLNSDTFERVKSVRVTGMDFMDSDASASSTSCFKSNSLGDIEGYQFHIASGGKLDENGQHSLETQTSTGGSPFQLSHDARLSGNDVDRQKPIANPEKDPNFVPSNFTCERNFMHDKPRITRNQYLAVQEACDKTSMVAYCFIGRLFNELAKVEGLYLDRRALSYLQVDNSVQKGCRAVKKDDISYEEEVNGSIILQVLEDILPTFPESHKDKMKELLGLN
ncbi:hypothetical protein NMG60_11028155 [Bertholletia excelsa]